jgi:hypothetical protein
MNNRPDKNCNSLRHFPSDMSVVLGLPIVVTMVAASWVMSLHGEAWLWAVAVSFGIAMFGAVLLFFAKFPLYRQGRFYSFGIEAVPESLRGFYRWGCRCAIVGCVLMLFLLVGSILWR